MHGPIYDVDNSTPFGRHDKAGQYWRAGAAFACSEPFGQKRLCGATQEESSSDLTFLRQLYRRAPLRFRRTIGGWAEHLRAPLRAARAPHAIGARWRERSVDIVGLFSAPLGVATAAQLCAMELEQRGVRVRRVDVSGALRATAAPPIVCDQGEPGGAVILALNPPAALVALDALGPAFLAGRRTIGYWVWELEQAPKTWRSLAHCVDEIWSPSAFSARALAAIFEAPTHVVPHPAALGVVAPPPDRAAHRDELGLRPADFACVFSFSFRSSMARKNPQAAIAAVSAAFGAHGGARFFLRAQHGGDYPEALAALKQDVANAGSVVQLIEAQDDRIGYAKLLNAADCFLSLHRSEGFGLAIAEAMLQALPVIATDWSGNLDFTQNGAAMLIPASLIPVRDAQGIYRASHARWAEPDVSAASAALRHLASEGPVRALQGERGRLHAMDVLSGGAALKLLEAARPPL